MRLARLAAVAVAAALAVACPGETSRPPVVLDAGTAALRRVVEAERTLAYSGWRRTVHGPEGESRATRMKVSRYPDGRTLLEWGDERGDPRKRWSLRSRHAWADDPDLLLANYAPSVVPADSPRVAWRDTRRLVLEGRVPGRPSLDLLVDRETGLVLREELRDFEGRTWMVAEFETIEYGPPAAVDDPTAEEIPGPRRGEGPALPLRVTEVPRGFVVRGGAAGAGGVVRADWSDGLAAFSVKQSPVEGRSEAAEGEVRRRQCGGRAWVSVVAQGVEVTVTGTIPADELEQVVRGLVAATPPGR